MNLLPRISQLQLAGALITVLFERHLPNPEQPFIAPAL